MGAYYTIYVPQIDPGSIVFSLAPGLSNPASYIRVGAQDNTHEASLASQWPDSVVPPDGIVLYTWGVFAVNATSYSQTSFGESYTEAYDSTDAGAPLISAAYTHQVAPGAWFTASYSQASTFQYTLSNNASLGIGMSYTYFFGPYLCQYGAYYDTSFASVSMPLFQVTLGDGSITRASMIGKAKYSPSWKQKAPSLTLQVGGKGGGYSSLVEAWDKLTGHWGVQLSLQLVTRCLRAFQVVVNDFVGVYTAVSVGIGNQRRSGVTPDAVKGFLQYGEVGAAIAEGLNTIGLVLGMFLGLVQLVAQAMDDALRLVGWATAKDLPPNL